jgi:hypothetical protein
MSSWIWMPHPGHFICAFDCRFHLNTKVGSVIVSTVGEYFPDEPVREIYAGVRGIKLKGIGDDRKQSYMKQIGYGEIGVDRKYETMVFRAQPRSGLQPLCCPWEPKDYEELEAQGYNDPGKAYAGHMELCKKWEHLIPLQRSKSDFRED